VPKQDVNVIDAAGRGAIEGLHLSLNVAGMLIAFIALVALVNGIFGYVHGQWVWFPASLDIVFGWIFRPIAWAMGVSWKDSLTVGNLLGTRMVLNEFVAFVKLGEPGIRDTLDPRSLVITTYALCGFANFSSIAIQIGGIGSLAPTRRGDLARLGLRAMIAGTLANFLTATIAGVLCNVACGGSACFCSREWESGGAACTHISAGPRAPREITWQWRLERKRASIAWMRERDLRRVQHLSLDDDSSFCTRLSGMPRHCGPE
jgi:hypothetical protein